MQIKKYLIKFIENIKEFFYILFIVFIVLLFCPEKNRKKNEHFFDGYFIDQNDVSKKILNVGCGNESFGTHFVDIYPSRNEVFKCDMNKDRLPFSNEYFDVVYSKNLFEHLTNIEHALSEMKRVLKKKGELILITDYAHFWGYAVGKTHLGGYENRRKMSKDKHYLLVNEHHLKNWLEKFGFRIKKIEFIESDFSNVGFFKKLVIKFVNRILRIIQLKRFSYDRIKVVAEKV